jgi:hypothetical protein
MADRLLVRLTKGLLHLASPLCPGLFFVLAAEFSLTGAQAEKMPYDTVKAASHFAIGGVGFAGITTPEELAMRKIRDGAKAEAQLHQLLRDATPAGQMYALFALRQLDSADYAALSAPFRQSPRPVPTISGCIIHTQTMGEAVRWIDRYAREMLSWEKGRPAPAR